MLSRLGVFWKHDGNPRRPYARLASGKISEGYFNGSVLAEHPYALENCARLLAREYLARAKEIPERIAVPAMGAITLGHALAHALEEHSRKQVRFSYAEKDEGRFIFKRNPPQERERILLAEDTLTTGGSIMKVVETARTLFTPILPYLVVLCNRTGKESLDGFEIISFISAHFRAWEEGSNPYTPGGRELVPPVERPKEGWSLLTKSYP